MLYGSGPFILPFGKMGRKPAAEPLPGMRFLPLAGSGYAETFSKTKITANPFPVLSEFTFVERVEAINPLTRVKEGAATFFGFNSKPNEESDEEKKAEGVGISENERSAPTPEFKELVGVHNLQPEGIRWHREQSGHTPGQIRQPMYTNLVTKELEMNEEVSGVEIPQWIVEMWQDSVELGMAFRRLGLPESSVKTKLPYYR